MLRAVGIGVGAGLAAALLFAALASGTPFAFPLFLLSPLPIAIATLGWGHFAGLAAALAGGLAIAAFTSSLVALVFVILFAGPVIWLAYLAGLSRPGEDGSAAAPEWFPIGRILLHAIGIVAAALIVLGIVFGFDKASLTKDTLDALEAFLASQPDAGAVVTRDRLEPWARTTVALMPYTLSSLILLTLVVDVWLAGRITAISGQFGRPWVPLWTTRLPAWATVLLLVAVLGSFIPGGIGSAFGAIAGATGFAFVLTGLAAVHAMTRGRVGRGAILTGTYVATIVLGLPALLLVIFGVVQSLRHWAAPGPSNE